MRVLLILMLAPLALAGCADDAETPQTTSSPTGSTPARPALVREDFQSFTLGPNQDIEWKYRLEEGAQMEYSWSAVRPVRFDFHGDYDDGTESFVSHKKDTLASDSDTFTAPFAGRHGWHFRNGNTQTVTVELQVTGNLEIVGRTGGNAP